MEQVMASVVNERGDGSRTLPGDAWLSGRVKKSLDPA
jgi:hypothetical protein